MSKQEEWRAIPGYPDYEVSSLGNIKRVTSRTCAKAGTLIKQCWRGGRGKSCGYLAVDLCFGGNKRTVSVHNLVAESFLSTRPHGFVVNHIDGDRSNNAADNLEWVTQSQNVKHAYDIGLSDAKGQRNGQAKLTNDDVLAIRRMAKGARGEYSEIARRFNVGARHVADIIKGKAWPHLLAA